MLSGCDEMPTTSRRELPPVVYKLLILSAALFWGGSFVVLTDAINAVTPTWLLAIRFSLAALVLGFICRKRIAQNFDRSHLFVGGVTGLLNGLGYLVQNIGLLGTTPGRNAFITAIYCVMTPFFYWAFAKKRPAIHNVVAAVLCVTGLGFLSLGDDLSLSLSWGDILTLVSAGFFAAEIASYACLAKDEDPITLTVVQFCAYAIVCAIGGLLTEPLPPASAFTQDFWLQMAYLVIASSCLATVAQNIGQKHVPAAEAALFLSFESVFGVLFSVLFGYEALTLTLFVGFAFIFVSMLITELMPSPEARAVEAELAAGGKPEL